MNAPFLFLLVDHWVLWKSLWVYLTFENTKTSEQDYAEDASAPTNSIVRQPYNFMEGDKVRTKRHVRISERAGYPHFHPQYRLQFRHEGDIFGHTFPTSNCLHLTPYKPWKSAKIVRLYSVCDVSCSWLVLLARLGISFPAQRSILTS